MDLMPHSMLCLPGTDLISMAGLDPWVYIADHFLVPGFQPPFEARLVPRSPQSPFRVPP